ncbi:MAG: carboxypeptidase regulatory-like domain-containing protein [Acidobacteriota bacterium]|nr:carboxypeptidase regulatory-like domain-containing protein [Acidobacteriota bacterium]
MRLRSLWVAIACFALAVPLVHAQTTGAISGWVRDGQGGAIPGATVTITSPNMPLGRSATSQGDGGFQFSGLIPGTYRLRAELSGMGIFQQDVVVSLSKETEVRAVLRATATAEVTVTAATPEVDTKSTTISNVTERATIEKLPLARTFAGTMQLAPGVADSGVAISNTNPGFNAGGGRQDNQFLYDGVNVTNPFFADLFQDFAELDIQEVNITRGGITAESGRTGGFLVNGVTKSGTNNFHGDVRLEYQPSGLEAKSKDPNLTSEFNRLRPGASVGGPILPDHLFFYGSANLYRSTEKDRFNRFNPVGGAGTPNSLPEGKLDINEYFAKVTATPMSNQLLEGSFRYRGVKQTNADIGSTGAASTGDNPKEIDRIAVASWFWTVNSKFNVEAKFNHNENHNGATPITSFGFLPAFNVTNPQLVGNFTLPNGSTVGGTQYATNNDDFFRDEYRLTASYLGSFFGASHDVRVGGTYSANKEELARIANGWGLITTSTSGSCNGIRPCFRARYSPDQPPQVSKARTYGLFAQDSMTWNHLTVNLGVLVNQDKYIPSGGTFIFMSGNYLVSNSTTVPDCSVGSVQGACTYRDTLTLPWSKQFQPRVGVSYEIDQTAHDKVYANFGRYDNLDNQSISRAASPIRLFRVDAFINGNNGAVIQNVVRSNQLDKRVLPTIDPTYTDEYLVGYARPLGQGFSVEAWGMYRKTLDVIEDFAATGNNFTDLNPGSFRYGNLKNEKRRYRAATIEVRKTGASARWTADLSYTLSRLEGNWDLDYASQLFYASSYIEDGPGNNVEDPHRNGILEGDRTHVAKLFGSYILPTNTTIGGYLRFQSGRPWQAQQYDPVYGVPYQYVEDAGARRLPSWTNLDLLVAQNIPLGGIGNLRLEGRLLNVFNAQPALSVDKVLFTNTGNTIPNPNFGKATSYASGRRFLATGTFTF